MAYFTVKTTVTMEAYLVEDVEADSHDEAEAIVKNMIWNDNLAGEIQACQTITDEDYEAQQEFLCPECGHEFNEHHMSRNETCPECDADLPDFINY